MNTDRARDVMIEAVGQVAPDVEPEKFDPTLSIRDQADLDSVDFLELVAQLAEVLHADIPQADYDQLETIDLAVAYLGPRLD